MCSLSHVNVKNDLKVDRKIQPILQCPTKSEVVTNVNVKDAANLVNVSPLHPLTTVLGPIQPTTSDADALVFNENRIHNTMVPNESMIHDEPNASCWNFVNDRNEISSDEDYFIDEPNDLFKERPKPKRTNYKQSVCRLCGITVGHMKEHMLEMHRDAKPYKCKLCDKTFRKKYYVLKHQQAHRHRVVVCELCDKKFSWIETFHSHMLMCHPTDKPKTLSCRYCPSTFRYTQDLNVHEQLHEAYDCKHCERTFASIQKLCSHHKEIHPDLVLEKPSEPYEFITLNMVGENDEPKAVKDNTTERTIAQGPTLTTAVKGDWSELIMDPNNIMSTESTDVRQPEAKITNLVKTVVTQSSEKKRKPLKKSNKSNKKQMITPNTDLMFRCKKCDFYFINESELIQHRGKVHKKKFRCKTCGIETEDILRHIMQHRYCCICKTNFDTAMEFTVHNSKVHLK